MSRKKNEKAGILSEPTQALAQLLADTADNQLFSFDGIEWNRLGALIAAFTGMGALVTLYVGSSDNRFCISVRAGSSKRSYDFDTPQELNAWVPGMEKQLSGLHKKLSQNGTVDPESHSKPSKGGDAGGSA